MLSGCGDAPSSTHSAPKTVLRCDAQGHLIVLTSSPIRRGLWNAFTVPGGRRSELPPRSTLAAVPTGTRYSPLFEGTSQLAGACNPSPLGQKRADIGREGETVARDKRYKECLQPVANPSYQERVRRPENRE